MITIREKRPIFGSSLAAHGVTFIRMKPPLFAIFLALCAGSAALAKPPKHIVFFLADDLGWTDLGCFGSTFYETPNLDRLAATGMKFTDAYASCPVCSPTRASIMTGLYPQRVGITDFIGAPQPEHYKRNTPLVPAPYTPQLDHEWQTLPEVLKANGFATFFAGKWHLGREEFWPEHQGFDINKGGIDRGGPYGGKKYFSPYGNPRLDDGPDGEHLPDRLASEACAFLEKNKDGKSLTYLSFYSVHTPLISREDLKKKYQAKKEKLGLEADWGKEGARKVRLVQEHAVYAGMVEAMDLAVGKVLDKLDALGIADETAVFFTSDNGGLSTSEGHPTSNLPLRGGKGWMYEGGIREPTIVRIPGVTPPGSVSDGIITSPDYLPTILAQTDIKHVFAEMDGRDISPLLRGEKVEDRPIFWHYPHYGNQGGSPSAAVRDGDWKLIEFYEDDRLELYNLKADLGEKNNLAKSNAAKATELKAKLDQWRKEVGAKMPTRR